MTRFLMSVRLLPALPSSARAQPGGRLPQARVVKSLMLSPRAALLLSRKRQMTETDSSASRQLARRRLVTRTLGVKP